MRRGRDAAVEDTGLGATRACAVSMNGRNGTMVERCVEAVPQTRASFLVVDGSFGLTTMLANSGFTAHFTPTTTEQSTVRIETFSTPANPIAAVLNRLVMRRQFRRVIDRLLGGAAHPRRTPPYQPEDLSRARAQPVLQWHR